jgi:hypothetical protein
VITRQQIRSVMADGGRLVDPVGQPVGRIVDVVLSWRTSQPTWATVHSPLCAGAGVVVPLAGARLLDGCVQVSYTAADVCGSPRGDGSGGRLEERREEELRRYYAVLDDAAPRGRTSLPPTTPLPPGAKPRRPRRCGRHCRR